MAIHHIEYGLTWFKDSNGIYHTSQYGMTIRRKASDERVWILPIWDPVAYEFRPTFEHFRIDRVMAYAEFLIASHWDGMRSN